jgi:hypothetical protein
MATHRRRRPRGAVAGLLALVVLTALLALAACGSSGTTTSESPSAAGSQSAAATVTTTPTPTPTHTWTPGAKPIPAATFPAQEGTTEGFQSSTNGWEFKPTVDIKVTDLGYFDDGGEGLRHPHPVGIFDTDTEKLLVKTTVQRMSPLDEACRFAKIQPLTLKAGKSYVVATVSYPPFDPEVSGPTGLVWAPEIEYVGYSETLTDKFVYPASSGYQFITANFKYRPLWSASRTPQSQVRALRPCRSCGCVRVLRTVLAPGPWSGPPAGGSQPLARMTREN